MDVRDLRDLRDERLVFVRFVRFSPRHLIAMDTVLGYSFEVEVWLIWWMSGCPDRWREALQSSNRWTVTCTVSFFPPLGEYSSTARQPIFPVTGEREL